MMSVALADVTDVLVFTDGNSTTCRIIRADKDSIAYSVPEMDSLISINIDEVYFAYNEFGRIIHISRSLKDRIEYIEKYPGYLRTLSGDSLEYRNIYFDQQMINPIVYLTRNDSLPVTKVPFLEIASLRMSKERFEVSVKRGCISGTTFMLLLSGLKTMGNFKAEYQGGGLFGEPGFEAMSKAVELSMSEFLPEADFLGTDKTGSLYRGTTLVLPLATVGWIAYEWYFDHRTVYVNPGQTNNPFPADMFIFNLSEWSDSKFRKMWTPFSRKILDKIYGLRKKIWKG